MFDWARRGLVPYLAQHHALDVLVAAALVWRFGMPWPDVATLLNTAPVAVLCAAYAVRACMRAWILRPMLYDELTVGQILKFNDVRAYMIWKRERNEKVE